MTISNRLLSVYLFVSRLWCSHDYSRTGGRCDVCGKRLSDDAAPGGGA